MQLEICSVCYSSLVSFQIHIGLNESESCGSCVVILVVTNSRYIIVCVGEKVHNDRQACMCVCVRVLLRAYYRHLNVDKNMLHHTKIPLCSGIFHKQNVFFAAADQTFHNRLRCAEPPHYNQMHGWSHLTCVCNLFSKSAMKLGDLQCIESFFRHIMSSYIDMESKTLGCELPMIHGLNVDSEER